MKEAKTSLEFGTFERNALSERIAMRLLQMIREQKLRPGDHLPPERDLAAMMQVSRPSLREALRALSIMNIIEHRQGSGTYVTSLEPERLSEYSRRRTVEIEGVPQSTIDSHRRLVKAIQSRDPEAAAEAMRQHLDFVEKRLKESGLGHQLVHPSEY
jgi:DNA-binding FadR family transcriptional regulator